MSSILQAGAATADITPSDSQFLFGYPHVRRYSTGVHDPLLSSALFLADGRTSLLMSANDVIYVSRQSVERVRRRIEQQTGLPATNIMVTATHTHSGPLTGDMLSNEADTAVPKTDPQYVEKLEEGIVAAAVRAVAGVRPAELGLALGDGSCVGGNRHDPSGPALPQLPILVVRDCHTHAYLAAMLICSMHPTVLHEDSTLLSGDFPAMTRQYLQEHLLGHNCPVLHHTGPSGNQSPRHVTQANTFQEAERLGGLLGQSVMRTIQSMEFTGTAELSCARTFVDLPRRVFPSITEAKKQLDRAAARLESLRSVGADRREIRTAECDWFGAEETFYLAQAAAEGRVEAAAASVMPAEIMLMRIGPWALVGWPGECFVEFPLMLKAEDPNCHVISLANGELQGYIVTEQAAREGWYEALNAMFAPGTAGLMLVEKTRELLRQQR